MLLRLFNLLLNHFMFAGTMFFAAGAVTLTGGDGGGVASGGTDGGAADGAATGDGSAGDGADAGGNDSGATDLDAAGDDAAKGRQADPNAPVDLGDGRTVPGKWKNLFDQAAKAGLGKEVRQLYFANQRLAKAIPGGVNGAIELAEAVEQAGGLEGIEQLQSDLEIHTSDAELFETNPAKWIEQSFLENSETSLAAFDHALGIVGDKFPEHYDHIGAKIVFDTVNNGSPIIHIHNLLAGLKDNPQAQQAAQKLAQWYHAIEDLAAKIPEKKVDAQQKALTDREARVEEREMGTRYTQVNAEVFPVMKSQVANTLKIEAKTRGIDLTKIAADYPGEFRAMMNQIHQEIMKQAIKDQRFVDKHYALVKKGDLKRAAAAVNAKHEKIVPDIVVRIAGDYGFMRGKKAAAGAAAGGGRTAGTAGADVNAAATGYAQINAKPANHLIDYGKTSQAMQLDGKYILKDGKRVQVHY